MAVVRSEVVTTDVEVAAEALRTAYRGARLSTPDRTDFRFSLRSVGDDRLTRLRLEGLTGAVGVIDEQPDVYVIGQPAERLGLRVGREQLDTSRPFLFPTRPAEGTWEDGFEVEVLHLRREVVQHLAREHDSRDAPVEFTGFAPISAERARLWAGTMALLHESVGDPALFDEDLVRDSLARMLSTALISTFPNTAMDAPAPVLAGTSTPAAVRRAVAFIEADPGRPISAADIAAAANMSIRGIQAAFKRATGATPNEYLRRVRLDAAHRELIAADPTAGATVVAIAARWGFTHPSRFAAAYRSAYGAYPADTLRG